jgi:hypothetical protein
VSITSIGLSCITRAETEASASAASLARTTAGSPATGDIAGDMVHLGQAANGVAIGAKVVEVGERLDKTLLDIFA